MEDRKKPIMWDRKAVYTRKGINKNLRKNVRYRFKWNLNAKRKLYESASYLS